MLFLFLLSTNTKSQQEVDLGSAGAFGVLSGSDGITNDGNTIVIGDVGTSGTRITGFPSGTVFGTEHINDDLAIKAHADANRAYAQAKNLRSDHDFSTKTDLTGRTLYPGVYTSTTDFKLGGSLTLDAKNTTKIFVFQLGTSLDINLGSRIILRNGAVASNIFWQVGNTATFALKVEFVGTVLAYAAIIVNTGTTVDGRLISNTSSVKLRNNVIKIPTHRQVFVN